MVELFTRAGFEVTAVERLTGIALRPRWWLPRLVARRWVDDVLTLQYVVVAHVRDAA